MIRPVDRPVDERGGMDYLGPEFLTWLWWRASVAPELIAGVKTTRAGLPWLTPA